MLNEILLYLLLTCGTMQFIVYVWFYPKATRNKNTNSSGKKPPISVVICAHNEEKNLNACLDSILNQKYPDFEVVVVNDRSSDRTAEIVFNFQQRYKNLVLVSVLETPTGYSPKKYALSKGIEKSKYDWLLLTDADCEARTENWISSMFENKNEKTNVIIGTSPFIAENSLLFYFQDFENQTTALQYLASANVGIPYMAVGRNLAYHKSVYEMAGGFENIKQHLGGDDDLFINKISKNIFVETRFCADSQILTKSKNRLKSYIYQKIRHLSVSPEYRFWHKILLGSINLSSAGLYFFCILNLFFNVNYEITFFVICLKISFVFITYLKFQKELNLKRKSLFQLAMIDLVYIFVLHVLGVYSFLFKPKKWHYGPKSIT